MALKIGIVGLPNVGKSTLFNALVEKGKALTGKHPFTTIDKNIGVVPVPDSTLVDLAKLANIQKITPTNISFIDIAGLVKGAHQGEGLGNKFLGHIREVDLILHVLRYFTDETVPHIHPKIDPEEDVTIVETELLLADIESIKKQIEKLKKEKKTKSTESLLDLLKRILNKLNEGKMAKELSFTKEEEEMIKSFNLLTLKPIVYAANVDETDLKNPPKKIKDKPTITLSAKFEEDLALLPWTEQRQFLKTYGLENSAIEQVIKSCYQTLEIITFYTIAGGKEARAWTIKTGATAIEAASKIHSDFVKNFIKAEIISSSLLLTIGSWHKAKELGKISLVGRNHIVSNHDVIEFKIGS